jgi:paraquat-inducible protein A
MNRHPGAPVPQRVACPECDTLQVLPTLPLGGTARCICCAARLVVCPRGGMDTPLALALAAFILYVTANAFPLVELQIGGRVQATSFTGAALALMRQDMLPLGLVVWVTSVLVPGLVLGITLYVLAALRLGRPWPGLRPLLVVLCRVRPWGMLDVFMLGILVSMVKLASMAQIVVGPGLYAFAPLLVVSAGVAATLEPRLLWERWEAQG